MNDLMYRRECHADKVHGEIGTISQNQYQPQTIHNAMLSYGILSP